MNSNRTYRYGHLDGFPFPFVPFSLPLSFSFPPFLFSGGLALCRLAPFPLSFGLRGLAFLFWQLIALSPGDAVLPSSFGRPGLSYLFRLVPPPSCDGWAGHSGFLSLFGSYLRHLRMAVLCHSYSWYARRIPEGDQPKGSLSVRVCPGRLTAGTP